MPNGTGETRIPVMLMRRGAGITMICLASILGVSCSESPTGDASGGREQRPASGPKNEPGEETKKSRASNSPESSDGDQTAKTTAEDIAEETSAPETTLENTTPESTTEETTSETEDIRADAPPDPAFDALLPDLLAITADTVMLPADLPEELGTPAIRAERPTGENVVYPEYEIVFTDAALEDTFAEPPRASMLGTLTSAPVPAGMPDETPEGFEETRTEEVELPDGTSAELSYLTPTEISNTPSMWRGRFEKDGVGYWLEVYGGDSAGETARRTLASMVGAPDAEETEESAEDEDPTATFIDDYYRAVSDEDWSETYSYLTEAAQEEFTEEEWATAQEIRTSQNPRPPIVAVETVGGTAAGDAAILDLLVTYEDGSEETLTGVTVVADTVNEPYGIKRSLSESDITYLRGLLEGS